jgi:hypothetical protein
MRALSVFQVRKTLLGQRRRAEQSQLCPRPARTSVEPRARVQMEATGQISTHCTVVTHTHSLLSEMAYPFVWTQVSSKWFRRQALMQNAHNSWNFALE